MPKKVILFYETHTDNNAKDTLRRLASYFKSIGITTFALETPEDYLEEYGSDDVTSSIKDILRMLPDYKGTLLPLIESNEFKDFLKGQGFNTVNIDIPLGDDLPFFMKSCDLDPKILPTRDLHMANKIIATLDSNITVIVGLVGCGHHQIADILREQGLQVLEYFFDIGITIDGGNSKEGANALRALKTKFTHDFKDGLSFKVPGTADEAFVTRTAEAIKQDISNKTHQLSGSTQISSSSAVHQRLETTDSNKDKKDDFKLDKSYLELLEKDFTKNVNKIWNFLAELHTFHTSGHQAISLKQGEILPEVGEVVKILEKLSTMYKDLGQENEEQQVLREIAFYTPHICSKDHDHQLVHAVKDISGEMLEQWE